MFLLEFSRLCFICLLASVSHREEQQVLLFSLLVSLYRMSFYLTRSLQDLFFPLVIKFHVAVPWFGCTGSVFLDMVWPFRSKNSCSSVLGKVYELFLWFFFPSIFSLLSPWSLIIWFLKLLYWISDLILFSLGGFCAFLHLFFGVSLTVLERVELNIYAQLAVFMWEAINFKI